MRRIFSLFLLLALLAAAVLPSVSCSSSAEGESKLPEGALTEAELLTYNILRDDNAAQEGIRNGMDLREAFEAEGYSLHLTTDFYREGIQGLEILPNEILVGKTNREETAAFLDSLTPWQWGYALIGTKIVIAGHSDETTAMAVEAFAKNIVKRSPLYFSEADRYVFGDTVEGAGRVYSVLTAYEEYGEENRTDEILAAVKERSPEIVVRVRAISGTEDPGGIDYLDSLLSEGYAVGFAGAAGMTVTEICYLESAYTFSAGETTKLLSYPNLAEEKKGALVYSVLRCRDTGKKMIFSAADLPDDSSSGARMKSVAQFLRYTESYPMALFGTGLNLGSKTETVQTDFFSSGYTPARSIAAEKSGEEETGSALFFPYERVAVTKTECLAPGISYTEFQEAAK